MNSAGEITSKLTAWSTYSQRGHGEFWFDHLADKAVEGGSPAGVYVDDSEAKEIALFAQELTYFRTPTKWIDAFVPKEKPPYNLFSKTPLTNHWERNQVAQFLNQASFVYEKDRFHIQVHTLPNQTAFLRQMVMEVPLVFNVALSLLLLGQMPKFFQTPLNYWDLESSVVDHVREKFAEEHPEITEFPLGDPLTPKKMGDWLRIVENEEPAMFQKLIEEMKETHADWEPVHGLNRFSPSAPIGDFSRKVWETIQEKRKVEVELERLKPAELPLPTAHVVSDSNSPLGWSYMVTPVSSISDEARAKESVDDWIRHESKVIFGDPLTEKREITEEEIQYWAEHIARIYNLPGHLMVTIIGNLVADLKSQGYNIRMSNSTSVNPNDTVASLGGATNTTPQVRQRGDERTDEDEEVDVLLYQLGTKPTVEDSPADNKQPIRLPRQIEAAIDYLKRHAGDTKKSAGLRKHSAHLTAERTLPNGSRDYPLEKRIIDTLVSLKRGEEKTDALEKEVDKLLTTIAERLIKEIEDPAVDTKEIQLLTATGKVGKTTLHQKMVGKSQFEDREGHGKLGLIMVRLLEPYGYDEVEDPTLAQRILETLLEEITSLYAAKGITLKTKTGKVEEWNSNEIGLHLEVEGEGTIDAADFYDLLEPLRGLIPASHNGVKVLAGVGIDSSSFEPYQGQSKGAGLVVDPSTLEVRKLGFQDQDGEPAYLVEQDRGHHNFRVTTSTASAWYPASAIVGSPAYFASPFDFYNIADERGIPRLDRKHVDPTTNLVDLKKLPQDQVLAGALHNFAVERGLPVTQGSAMSFIIGQLRVFGGRQFILLASDDEINRALNLQRILEAEWHDDVDSLFERFREFVAYYRRLGIEQSQFGRFEYHRVLYNLHTNILHGWLSQLTLTNMLESDDSSEKFDWPFENVTKGPTPDFKPNMALTVLLDYLRTFKEGLVKIKPFLKNAPPRLARQFSEAMQRISHIEQRLMSIIEHGTSLSNGIDLEHHEMNIASWVDQSGVKIMKEMRPLFDLPQRNPEKTESPEVNNYENAENDAHFPLQAFVDGSSTKLVKRAQTILTALFTKYQKGGGVGEERAGVRHYPFQDVPEELSEVTGLSPNYLRTFLREVSFFREQIEDPEADARDALNFLQWLGQNPQLAVPIYTRDGRDGIGYEGEYTGPNQAFDYLDQSLRVSEWLGRYRTYLEKVEEVFGKWAGPTLEERVGHNFGTTIIVGDRKFYLYWSLGMFEGRYGFRMAIWSSDVELDTAWINFELHGDTIVIPNAQSGREGGHLEIVRAFGQDVAGLNLLLVALMEWGRQHGYRKIRGVKGLSQAWIVFHRTREDGDVNDETITAEYDDRWERFGLHDVGEDSIWYEGDLAGLEPGFFLPVMASGTQREAVRHILFAQTHLTFNKEKKSLEAGRQFVRTSWDAQKDVLLDDSLFVRDENDELILLGLIPANQLIAKISGNFENGKVVASSISVNIMKENSLAVRRIEAEVRAELALAIKEKRKLYSLEVAEINLTAEGLTMAELFERAKITEPWRIFEETRREGRAILEFVDNSTIRMVTGVDEADQHDAILFWEGDKIRIYIDKSLSQLYRALHFLQLISSSLTSRIVDTMTERMMIASSMVDLMKLRLGIAVEKRDLRKLRQKSEAALVELSEEIEEDLPLIFDAAAGQ